MDNHAVGVGTVSLNGGGGHRTPAGDGVSHERR